MAKTSGAAAAPPVHKDKKMAEDAIPYKMALLTYVGFGIYMLYGYIHEYWNRIIGDEDTAYSNTEEGFPSLFENGEYFYTRRIFGRVRDCWDRPICSEPGAYITVLERKGRKMNYEVKATGNTIRCLNLSSYNYLGFGQNSGSAIEEVVETLHRYGASTCSTRVEAGTTAVHEELEREVARFVGKEDAVVFCMGYATNSLSIPSLIGKGDLVISDRLNHASIVRGCRNSGAKVVTFAHNSPAHLEKVIRNAIAYGQPRTRRPWRKILIIVEGIYSMEGEICRLPEIIAIKKKYKCYLYVDEAHSIGALGSSGRGVVEYWGADPADIDILMGTFTKSFGSCGGYIAGDRALIDAVRRHSFGTLYDTSMTAPTAQMALSALRIIGGLDGTRDGERRLMALHDNANYFRTRLIDMGFTVLGDHDSPVVPMMIYHPSSVAYFSREMLRLGVAVVVVGYPATAMLGTRCRFCISAAHTFRDLDRALELIELIGTQMGVRFGDVLST